MPLILYPALFSHLLVFVCPPEGPASVRCPHVDDRRVTLDPLKKLFSLATVDEAPHPRSDRGVRPLPIYMYIYRVYAVSGSVSLKHERGIGAEVEKAEVDAVVGTDRLCSIGASWPVGGSYLDSAPVSASSVGS